MIEYRSDKKITEEEFIDVLKRSTLDRRRPVDDRGRIQAMLDHCNVLLTAWDGDLLVGVSRALSDFSFCCYLSDLAVDRNYQKKGIGKRLIEETHKFRERTPPLFFWPHLTPPNIIPTSAWSGLPIAS